MTNFWEKTIKAYKNLITYPNLEEKYLKRPPFRYLLQIFISLDKKTQFAKGLFQQAELQSKHYSSAEKKMEFLKKLMRLVMKVGGKELIVRPQSVIKGVDCEKTNEFLVEMARVACLGSDNEAVIGDILGKEKVRNEKRKEEGKKKKSMLRSWDFFVWNIFADWGLKYFMIE